jgi:hypothetical protein
MPVFGPGLLGIHCLRQVHRALKGARKSLASLEQDPFGWNGLTPTSHDQITLPDHDAYLLRNHVRKVYYDQVRICHFMKVNKRPPD